MAKRPNVAMLLGHLSQWHRGQLHPYLHCMENECLETMVVKLFEVVEKHKPR
jgi:hypothetical protein